MMEQERQQPVAHASTRRQSVFLEVGLVDEDAVRRQRSPAPTLVCDLNAKKLRLARTARFESENKIVYDSEDDRSDETNSASKSDSDNELDALDATRPDSTVLYNKLYRLGIFAAILALILPVLQINIMSLIGVKGSVIPQESIEYSAYSQLERRDGGSTDVCKRWAGQSTILNGTLYLYGFRKTTDAKQTTDTWTNDFLSLDLTKSWQIAQPSLSALPTPSGPPAVSLGHLFHSHSSLYLYGGEFSDKPAESPTPNSVWEYNVGSKKWTEHKDPKTSSGDSAEDAGQSVQRAAEGAGFSVSNLGRAWYFAGHLDHFTTEGWDYSIPRVYLSSLLEFTFPGYSNEAVDDLKGGKQAGEDGAYRNITGGGTQGSASFPERADSVIVYVPGFGDEGTLLGLTGGDNDTFTQMNVIDVYDIAKSTWYKQSTSGNKPKYRVNPCAVVAAAADGSSYNVYMYGGQNLQPADNQTQYDDMWILSVPSFTWIEVDQSGGSPYARAGHSCHIWDGQMVVVGGYVGTELSCDTPGIYSFNLSSLQWSDQFTALTGDKALQAWDGKEDSPGNPLAQQANQRGFDQKAGLEGSYGYAVPAAVQSVIGGKETGGATLTAPVQSPTEGPFKTGTAQTYTVTGPDGAIITQTVDSNNSIPQNRGPNIGAIVAGTIAGIFFLIAAYFAFCAWVYRRQVKIWKDHAAMVVSRAQNNEKNDPFAAQGTSAIASSGKNSSERAQRDFLATRSSEATRSIHTNDERNHTAYAGAAGVAGASGSGPGATDALGRRSSVASSTDDLLAGQEPAFWGTRGVLLNPRRSLRVINRD